MRSTILAALLLATAVPAVAQRGEARLAFSTYGSLTTSSKLFPNPNARDELIRGGYSPINSVFSFGADVRAYLPALGLRLGLGAEYISGGITSAVPNTPRVIPVEDGYVAVPVELTGYFTIPVGGQFFDFYMGGGAGVYFGGRRYIYAGREAETVDRSVTPGIHVLTGLEYLLTPSVSVRTELKFRNVQLESVQRFTETFTTFDGVVVPLPQDPQTSRIQVDGMHLSLGVSWRLP